METNRAQDHRADASKNNGRKRVISAPAARAEEARGDSSVARYRRPYAKRGEPAKDSVIQIRVTKRLHKQFRTVVAAQDESMSEVLERSIRNYIKEWA